MSTCFSSLRRLLQRLAVLGLVVSALAPTIALAVPPEYLRDLVLHPSDPNVLVLRYENAFGGLLFSRDGGRSLQIVPGRTFYNYSLQRNVPMLIGGDGKLQIALDSGLLLDDGMGCFAAPPSDAASASEAAVKELWIADLARHPGDQGVSFLISTADGKGKHVGVWKRDKQGVMSPIGTSEPVPAMPGKFPFIASSLRVLTRAASAEGLRFLVAGTQYDHSMTPPIGTPTLRVSDDLAKTWASYAIPSASKNGVPQIVHADGGDPFKAVIALEEGFGDESDDPIDRLVVTQDGGKSFAPFLDKIVAIGATVKLPSGQILIADRGPSGGLWSTANLNATPTKISDRSVRCLAYQPETQKLFMCGIAELGLYDVVTNSFCAMFRMNETTSFVNCPAAPLAQNKKTADQLCNGWCGAAHYASTAFCSSFQDQPEVLCGPGAYAYDNDSPDPEKRWIEPPGNNSAPRCEGFVGRADAGIPSAPAVVDAGNASVATDAASPSGADADAAVSTLTDASTSTRDDAGATPPSTRRVRSCQVWLVGEPDEHVPSALAMAFLALSALARRRVRWRVESNKLASNSESCRCAGDGCTRLSAR